MAEQRFDVIQVKISEPRLVRVLETNKDERNADAVVTMAVIRRGVGPYFFAAVPAGTYRDGDIYNPRHRRRHRRGEGRWVIGKVQAARVVAGVVLRCEFT